MNPCPTDIDLDRYHAGELAEAEEARVREHLTQCADCARRDAELVAQHEQLLGRLKGMVLSGTEAAPPQRAAENPPQERITAVDLERRGSSSPCWCPSANGGV